MTRLPAPEEGEGAPGTRQSAGGGQGYSPGRDPAVQKDLLTRLKKIEGQVRGIQKMIGEGRDCADIITQLTAVKAAINRVSITVLACHLAEQIENDLREKRQLKDSLAGFMDIFKKFS